MSSTTISDSTLARRHMRFGWLGLLGFASLGLLLEAMHGFKIGWYLDADQETRRLLFTLAHAHGVLLSLLNVAYAPAVREFGAAPLAAASPLLLGAQLAMPAGFFLGGLVIYDGDPGLGIFLVPVGAMMLLAGLALVVRAVWRAGD